MAENDFALTPTVSIPISEIEFHAIRAQGAGGQNINKVSDAIHLRFSIPGSSLPEELKRRLLACGDRRISADGVVVIKAQASRSLAANRRDALLRLRALVEAAAHRPRARVPTRPPRSANRKRLEGKKHRAGIKAGRKAPVGE